jgi:hypothetical protein
MNRLYALDTKNLSQGRFRRFYHPHNYNALLSDQIPNCAFTYHYEIMITYHLSNVITTETIILF